jgi:hypothetical protein
MSLTIKSSQQDCIPHRHRVSELRASTRDNCSGNRVFVKPTTFHGAIDLLGRSYDLVNCQTSQPIRNDRPDISWFEAVLTQFEILPSQSRKHRRCKLILLNSDVPSKAFECSVSFTKHLSFTMSTVEVKDASVKPACTPYVSQL